MVSAVAGRQGPDAYRTSEESNTHRKSKRHLRFSSLLLLAFLSAPSWAQTFTISGTITDASDSAPIAANYCIILPDLETAPFCGTAAADGTYTTDPLPPGQYIVATEPTGDYIREAYDNVPELGFGNFFERADFITLDTANVVGIDFALDLGFRISGSITGSDTGDPVVGAEICVYETDGTGVFCTSIDDGTGNYETPPMLAGQYKVLINRSPGYVFEAYDDVSIVDSDDPFLDATVINVVSNTPSIDFVLDPGFTISGIVTDEASGDPIENADICVFLPGNDRAFCSPTESDGSYISQALPPGDYAVEVSQAVGFVSELFDDVQLIGFFDYVASADLVTLGPDVAGIDFALEAGFSISGRITDSASGDPILDAEICVFETDGTGVTCVTESGDGFYTTPVIPPGDYVVGMNRAPGYIFEFYDDVVALGFDDPVVSATQINLNSDQAGIDFALDEGFTISGTLTAENDGSPIMGTVCIYEQDGTGVTCPESDDTGFYESQALPQGDYVVLTNPIPGFVAEIYDNIQQIGFEDPFLMADPVAVGPNDATGIDFALQQGFTISGTITDQSTGDPVIDGEICVYETDGTGVLCAGAEADGSYTTPEVPAGAYVVVINNAPGFVHEIYDDIQDLGFQNNFALADFVFTGPSDVSGIDFALEPGNTISGQLTDEATGLPIEGEICVLTDAGEGVTCTQTDENGFYTTAAMPPGEYVLFINNASGYVHEFYDDIQDIGFQDNALIAARVDTSASDVGGIDFALEQGFRISGVVTESATGFVVEGVLVCLRDTDRNGVTCAETDGLGAYETSDVPAGDYVAFVDAGESGLIGEFYDNIREDDPSGDPFSLADVISLAGASVGGIDFELDIEDVPRLWVLEKVVDENTPVPGQRGVTFERCCFRNASIDNGLIAFNGRFIDSDGFSRNAIISFENGALAVEVDHNTIVPGEDATFRSVHRPDVKNGSIIFTGSYVDDVDTYVTGVWRIDNGVVEGLVDDQDSDPVTNEIFQQGSIVGLSNGGDRAAFTAGTPGCLQFRSHRHTYRCGFFSTCSYIHTFCVTRPTRLLTSDASGLNSVVSNRDPIPGRSELFRYFSSAALDGNDLSFAAGGRVGTTGIYEQHNGNLVAIFERGDVFPDGATITQYTYEVSRSDGGTGFYASGRDATNRYSYAVFDSFDGDVRTIASSTTRVPGTTTNFGSPASVSLDRSDAVFRANWFDERIGTWSYGTFSEFDSRLLPIVQTGDELDGNVVRSAWFSGTNALSDYAAVLEVRFQDDSRALYKASLDSDQDGVFDNTDNCRLLANPGQEDADDNGVGDLCEDSDADTIPDFLDNCPVTPNSDQLDGDSDAFGDVCDVCPALASQDQTDTDGDGVGDLCDNDADDDGIDNEFDNCPTVPNAGQENLDGDTSGDACDPDIDGDSILNSVDGRITGAGFRDDSRSPSNRFTDEHLGGTSFGQVFIGINITISDAPNGDDGLLVQAANDGSFGYLRQCGLRFRDGGGLLVNDGDAAIITCGSMRIEVLGEEMELELGALTADFPSGVVATLSEPGPDQVSFEVPPESRDAMQVFMGDSLMMTVPAAVTATVTETLTPDDEFAFQVSVDPDSQQPVMLELNGQIIEIEPGTEPTTLVNIDVRPFDRNHVIRQSRAPLPVAILSSSVFDATTVDPTTVMFAGAPVMTKNNGALRIEVLDANADGLDDMVLDFESRSLVLEDDAESATLTGETTSGEPVRGSDSVIILK